jgi:hypothetical protein
LTFEIPLSNVSSVPTGEDAEPEEMVEKFRQSVMKFVEGETDLPLVTLQEIFCATPRYVKIFKTLINFFV